MGIYPTGKTVDAAELSPDFRRHPIDDHGKLRYAYGKVTSPAGGVAANSTLGLLWLPTGRKRLVLPLSYIAWGIFGAGRTLDVGHAAYGTRPPSETPEADNPDALIDGLDVAVAGQRQFGVTAAAVPMKYDMYSTEEVLIYATVLGGTMPEGITVEVLLAYLYE